MKKSFYRVKSFIYTVGITYPTEANRRYVAQKRHLGFWWGYIGYAHYHEKNALADIEEHKKQDLKASHKYVG